MSDEDGEKKSRKAKPFFDAKITCPNRECGRSLHVQAFRKTVTPAVPAEVEIEVTVDGAQCTLAGDEDE
jgi:hypothetical protein